MFRKIFATLLIPVILALAIWQGVFASDIEVEGTKVLGDGTSTQTVDGAYDPASWEIEVTKTEDIQSGISNTILSDIIDTACAFRDIYCYKDDFNDDGKLDYIQLNKATWEVKYYEFAGTDTQLFSNKYALIDNKLIGIKNIISLKQKEILWESNNRWVIIIWEKDLVAGTTGWDQNYLIFNLDFDNSISDTIQLMKYKHYSYSNAYWNLQLSTTPSWKKVFKYTFISWDTSTRGGDSSAGMIIGTLWGLKVNHSYIRYNHDIDMGRPVKIEKNKSVLYAYRQNRNVSRFADHIINQNYHVLNLDNTIHFYAWGRVIYFTSDGEIKKFNISEWWNTKTFYLIDKMSNINSNYNYYLVWISNLYWDNYTHVNISKVDKNFILIKTDKQGFYISHKVFSWPNQDASIVRTWHRVYEYETPKVMDTKEDNWNHKGYILYFYKGKLYRIVVDANNEQVNFSTITTNNNLHYLTRTYWGYLAGNIWTSSLNNIMLSLWNDYFYNQGVIYKKDNQLNFVPKEYVNINNDYGGWFREEYYDGRHGHWKQWLDKWEIKDTNWIKSVIYEKHPKDAIYGYAWDTIRSIEKDWKKIIILWRKEHQDYHRIYEERTWTIRGRTFIYQAAIPYFNSNIKYSYIFDPSTWQMVEKVYWRKVNPHHYYASKSYKNDWRVTNVNVWRKSYNINGLTFTLE